ncbi:hypothetical protein CFN78_21325 [Amycolatopsis antarctica]|uniref:Uncharacterized protein n=1 Tax=Amycolatopsis antarctica TaxID=1854586 RepID=A0A263CYT0_9PSEU|nr:hypothetical protein [Amycolatopsis antarctica]OZM71330.1 hypothetical protein CFN78_21325 [Amycolatopsis antarctica]
MAGLMMETDGTQQGIAQLDTSFLDKAAAPLANAGRSVADTCGLELPGCADFTRACADTAEKLTQHVESVRQGLLAYQSIGEFGTSRYRTADQVSREAITQAIDREPGMGAG